MSEGRPIAGATRRAVHHEPTEATDTAGIRHTVALDALAALRYAHPYRDSSPVPWGHWAATAALRRRIRRGERMGAAS